MWSKNVLTKITEKIIEGHWKWKHNFRPYTKTTFQLTQYKESLDILGTVDVPIENIRGRIITDSGLKILPLNKTPHYILISSMIEGKKPDDHEYKKYYRRFHSSANLQGRIGRVQYIIQNCEKLDYGVSMLSIKGFNNYQFVLIDGVHRATTALVLGKKKIKTYLLQ